MLTIALDKLCYLIVKAREFDAKMEPEVPDPGDNPVDDADRQILFDYPDDPTVEEIRACLEGLNEDESAEVLALVWLGRGDYDAEEWPVIVSTALEDADRRRPEALLGIPLLADFLEEGLSLLGYSCADEEMGRL
ncbi:MAG: DUF3775 domain-containing protein [Rhodospirillales bacterium]